MLCNIKPVPFHESDKHIFAKIPVGGGGSGPPVPASGSAHDQEVGQKPSKSAKLKNIYAIF